MQNALPQNTDPGSISAAKQMFEEANSKCPNTKIVAGGYRYISLSPLPSPISMLEAKEYHADVDVGETVKEAL